MFLSTSEPVAAGKILNPTKSFSNRFVFNTAITRAQSLIVGVGNPFLLLEMEKHMIQTYGYDERGKCWSNFIKKCLSNKTLHFDVSLNLSTVQENNMLKRIKEAVDKQLIKQKHSGAQASLMKDDLLSPAFPVVPVSSKRKRRSKCKQKQKFATMEDCRAQIPSLESMDVEKQLHMKSGTGHKISLKETGDDMQVLSSR